MCGRVGLTLALYPSSEVNNQMMHKDMLTQSMIITVVSSLEGNSLVIPY